MKFIASEAFTAESEYDFRNTFWGMDKASIMQTQGEGTKSKGPGYLTYEDRFMDMDAIVCFQFAEDELIEAGYAFRENMKDERQYLEKYDEIRSHITSRFGEPSIDVDILESYGGDGASGVRSGDHVEDTMMYLVEWRTERTIIRLILMGRPESCEFGLLYMSNDYVRKLASDRLELVETFN